MKGILCRRLVLLLVFVIHAVIKCQATFCFDHYNTLVKEIREHQSRCSVQDNNGSPCCEAEASSLEERRPKNCPVLYNMNFTQNGVYTIDPDGLGSFNVSCDMTTDGGGWTVFQRRQDGSVDFYRNWTDYKNGFGNMSGEFWLGLEKINRVTKNKDMELRVDLEDFEGGKKYARYSKFVVEDENKNYKLTVEGYEGDAGDSLGYHNGMKFSTKDRDNDLLFYLSCARVTKGGWWHNSCRYSNLNGLYLRGTHPGRANGVNWKHWRGVFYSLQKTEMKMRPSKS